MTRVVERRRLNRDLVLDAALALVDESGPEGLSMRLLGARLGVEAMSLYNHVASKADLLDGLHERLVLEVAVDLHEDEPWTEALRRFAAAYRQVAVSHRRAFVLLATRPLGTTPAVMHLEPLFAMLGRSGFAPAQRLLLLDTYFTFLNGFLLAEVGTVPGHADVPEPNLLGAFRASPDPGSDVAMAVDDLTTGWEGLSASFDTAVGLVIAGLATLQPES